jgi:hypothetical protein
MRATIAIGLALAAAGGWMARGAQDPPDMEKEMAKAKKWMSPGKNHELLKRFVGSWTTETAMMGAPPVKGTAEVDWLMEGRWLRMDSKTTLFGKPFSNFAIMGYDNFKMSYVITKVSSFDTSMIRVEGDLDQTGKSLVCYGTLDEYLTGEHDKAIKVAYRFLSDDSFVMEVHDFGIGEEKTKVFDVTYSRKK